MRTKSTTAILAALAVLAVLVLPAGALGAAHFYRQAAAVDAELHLRGTHGFRFIAFTFGDTDLVSASRRVPKFGDESVDYFAKVHRPGFADGNLAMKFGKQGQFRGRFIAKSTKTRKPARGCTGDPTTIESGFFVGSFNLHGERGYSSIHAQRVSGSVTRLGATRCRIPTRHAGHDETGSGKEAKESSEREFRLVAGDPKAQVFFEASREEPAQLEGETATTFEASSRGGKAGAFEVTRSAFVLDFDSDATSTFQVPNLAEPLAEAILEPAAPFSGAATFHLETPTSASWTGNLAVELPGLGKLPLTGGKLSAGLCHGPSHCTKTLPKDLQPVLETGTDTAVAIETQVIR